MQGFDFEGFKTKKCRLNHEPFEMSPRFLSCPHFHSKDDKRRNPFLAGDASPRRLAYSEHYIQDYFSINFASNLVEHLFHPNVYKTIICTVPVATPSPYAQPRSLSQCPNKYCPYLHEGQKADELLPLRNLVGPDWSSSKFHSYLAEDIKKLAEYRGQGEKPFKEEVEKAKQLFRARFKAQRVANEGKAPNLEIVKQKSQQKTVIEEGRLLQDGKPKDLGKLDKNNQRQAFKLQAQKRLTEKGSFQYHLYNYFQYGERLPIVEDRHHEFKNYRDIVNNSIVPTVMKYITAFLNSQGGVLYIGIDDSSVVYGFHLTQGEFDRFLLQVDKAGKFNMSPPLMPQKCSIRRIPVYRSKTQKSLFVLEIRVTPSQRDKRNGVLTTYNRQCFMRMNASTHKLDTLDLLQFVRLNEEKGRNCSDLAEQMLKKLGEKDISFEQLTEIKYNLAKINEKLQKVAQRIQSGQP